MKPELDLSPRSVDLVADGFDVAIRVGRIADSQMTSRKLGAARSGIYASPDYLARAGKPSTPSALSAHSCIRVSRPGEPGATWSLLRGVERVDVRVTGRFEVNNIRVILQLAALGMGVAIIDAAMARDEVAAGRLARILPDWSPPLVPIHALTPTKLLPAKTRVFIECLSEHIDGLETS